jgi:hypothetical protein
MTGLAAEITAAVPKASVFRRFMASLQLGAWSEKSRWTRYVKQNNEKLTKLAAMKVHM